MLPRVPPPWEPLFVPFISPVPVLLLVAYNTMNTIHKTVRTRTRASKTFSSRDRFFLIGLLLTETDSPFSILSCARCCSFGSSPLSIFLLYWAEDMAMVLVRTLAAIKPLELLSLQTQNRNKFRKVSQQLIVEQDRRNSAKYRLSVALTPKFETEVQMSNLYCHLF